MSFGTIYKITNLVTNKSYIGQTRQNPSVYVPDHFTRALRGANPTRALYRSIRKYGKDKFTWSILATGNSKQELDELEIKFVAENNSYNNGYNMQKGGETRFVGPRHSEKMKQETSARLKKQWATPEWKTNYLNKIKSRLRRTDVPQIEIISPTGERTILAVGLQNFCKQNNLSFTVMRSWIDRGKIHFDRHVRQQVSKNAEGWELRRLQ